MTPPLPSQAGRSRLAVRSFFVAATAALLSAVTALASSPASAATGPDLAKGTAFLLAPTRLVDGHYYESFPGFSDFGLTMDAGFALAAAGTDDVALKRIVDFFDSAGADASGQTVNDWTGIGTEFVSGGALGKEAVLAQVAGYDPRSFAGKDVIAALDASICTAASPAPDPTCAAAGNYANATSVFSQSLGIIAQLRAGDGAAAAGPISYLQSLQSPSGSWPSLIPDSGNADIDSTAIAAMALALVGTPAASAAVTSGLSWIASQQSSSGGFPGVSPDSINSTALAVQALKLAPATYSAQAELALSFLAGQQNADGGFNVDPATPGSDVRASTQAISGAVGTSFATLSRDVHALPSVPASTPPTTTAPPTSTRPSSPTTVRPSSSPKTSPTPSRSATGPAPAPTAAIDPSSAAVAPQELANTGARTLPLLGLAVLLIGAGAILLLASRQRQASRAARGR